MNRSVIATAVASLLVLSAQAAFAGTSSSSAQIAAPSTKTIAAIPSTTSISMPAPVDKPAARIPGSFPNASYEDALEQLHVLMPALSGNGGA